MFIILARACHGALSHDETTIDSTCFEAFPKRIYIEQDLNNSKLMITRCVHFLCLQMIGFKYLNHALVEFK